MDEGLCHGLHRGGWWPAGGGGQSVRLRFGQGRAVDPDQPGDSGRGRLLRQGLRVLCGSVPSGLRADRPEDRKPSLRAILSLVEKVGADLSGLINSDILLLDPPGWIETVEAEVADSIIAFSRFEIDEERTCVGAAPWGIDLFFLDR